MRIGWNQVNSACRFDDSILNGLGKTKTTFIHNVSALPIRIGFVLFVIPRYGILAYLWGMLTSKIALALMHLWSLRNLVPFTWIKIRVQSIYNAIPFHSKI